MRWSGKLKMPDWDPYRLLYRHTIGASALTRRELIDDVGGFDPDIRGFEDWELWLHALAKGWHGVRVPAVTILYRRQADATNFTSARREYRRWYGAIRAKHADLYARRVGACARKQARDPGPGRLSLLLGPASGPGCAGAAAVQRALGAASPMSGFQFADRPLGVRHRRLRPAGKLAGQGAAGARRARRRCCERDAVGRVGAGARGHRGAGQRRATATSATRR